MSVLDFAALDATPLTRDPLDFLVVPGFIRPEALADINRDYPAISGPGNFALESLACGPAFEKLVEELRGDEIERRLSAKFGVELGQAARNLTLRSYSQPSDGNIHTDSWTKVVTTLFYFNPDWTDPGGRLRFLRSANDIEDYAAEVSPHGGTLVAFRRSDRSFHGHKPFTGERRMLQMSWVQPTRSASLALALKRWSTRLQKRLHLDRANKI